MKNGDIHIGPCWTAEKYRGKGIYPYILGCILNDYLRKDVYIFCDEKNYSSIKGIQKVGFELCGYGERTKPLGISFLGRFVFNFYEARDGSCYPKDK
jgi:RimJ/RimL family protein N-acetyltransferase